MDFTLKIYKQLLKSLQEQGYVFYTFEKWCGLSEFPDKYIILRHDVDEMAKNALRMAKLEHDLGICATYNFRIVKQSNKPDIIKEIRDKGHEIGYHYEDLASTGGNYEKAMINFRNNLAYFRSYYPVNTVCMHGSSTSKYDNRDLWKKYSLQSERLLGEPYLSIDFNKIYYISDTGYCWDGFKTAVRDVVTSDFPNVYHHTSEIITAVQKDEFPHKAMILAHTLWTDNIFLWYFIYFREFVRNKVKRMSRNNRLVQKMYGKFVNYYWKMK